MKPSKQFRTEEVASDIFIIIVTAINLIFITRYHKYIAWFTTESDGSVTSQSMITDDYFAWLPVPVTASILVIISNIVMIAYNRYWYRQTAWIMYCLFGITVVVSLATIFPFDFSVIPDPGTAEAAPIWVRVFLIFMAVFYAVTAVVMFVKTRKHLAKQKKPGQMKAIVCPKYGSTDVLQLKEVEKPVPKDDEALVKIHAASINAADFEAMRGVFVVRIAAPFKPRHKILGSDVAGRIESVGSNVKEFKPGDEIWGDLSYPFSYSTFAEYVCIPEKALRLKPAGMTFEEAAATPSSAIVALQNLRDKIPIKQGQKVLINGAGGGVGTFAIQLAKYFGVEVTAVDSTEKLGMLSSLGADHVIDYTKEDYTKTGQRYDRILDVVAYRSVFAYKRTLSPNGFFVYVGGSTSAIFQALFVGSLISATGSKKMGIVRWEPNNKEDLELLTGLFETGKVKPVIDRCYPLSETVEAIRYVEEGHAKGKVVISM